jgi:hypothetical protein
VEAGVKIVAAILALVLAALALALARDVDGRADTLDAADARFSVAPSARESWRADSLLPAGVVRGTLGVADDEQVREALRLFRAAFGRRAQIGPGEDVQAARAAAEAALTPIAARSDRNIAAQARDLLGLLAVDDPSAGAPGGPSPLERALSSFDAAVRLDPGNEAAKTNLELALRLLEARGARPGSATGNGPRARGNRGAGAGREGQGY